MMDSREVPEKTPLGATGCTQPVWRKLPPEHGLSTTRGTRTRWPSIWLRATTPESILSHLD